MSILDRIASRRTLEDLPAVASDDELVVWNQGLTVRRARPNRPLVAKRIASTVSTEELLTEIEERATDVYARRRVIVRRKGLASRTNTS